MKKAKYKQKKLLKGLKILFVNVIKNKILFILCFLPSIVLAQNRWAIQKNGSIQWDINKGVAHYDHIEMSGEQVSTVLRYGVDIEGSFKLERSLIWPMLRTIPNNTHASLTQKFALDFISQLAVNGLALKKKPQSTFL